MDNQPKIDHLFRHQYGRMVSILTKIFGLTNLELIEDAVQDAFVKALTAWRMEVPNNPEAWLMQTAKHRMIDIFRKQSAEKKRLPKLNLDTDSHAFPELFLESEIADSQLRMIFTACHPALKPSDQIAFALKTIAGFSHSEIATALLLKEETVKKRLSRARKVIQTKGLDFEIPTGQKLPERLEQVQKVLYLLFNEGFHSNQQSLLIRKDLCGEAIRLSKMLLENDYTNTSASYALFAIMCFQSARLEAKTNEYQELIDLKNQDRKVWYLPLIKIGNRAMNNALEKLKNKDYSIYHYEAAIAAEHLKADCFENTNWQNILRWYQQLYTLQPDELILLNMAVVNLQLNQLDAAKILLSNIDIKKLEQRAYLYHGVKAEIFLKSNLPQLALKSLDDALDMVSNNMEKQFLQKKKQHLKSLIL